MRLSIVIPSHQRTDLLALCLTSLQRHAPAGTEVLVVDDASPGEAVSDAARRFPGVRVLRLPRRSGFCRAVNAGLLHVDGDVVELLNDDTEVTAGWAESALSWFRDQHIGAVAPLVLIGPAGERIDSAGDRYFLGGIAGKHGHGLPLQPGHWPARLVFGASGSSAFYRREVLRRCGALPEHFGAYFEDVDLAFRLQRAGYRTMFEPASRVLHRGSASHGRLRRRLVEMQSCNEERVFWRNLPGRELARCLPLHLGVLLAKAWRRWHEGTLTPFVLGRLRVLAEAAEVLRHRRQLRQLGPDAAPEEWSVERKWFFGASRAA